MRKAESSSAIDAPAGTPKAMVGTRCPPSLELSDAIAAITPRISPLPKFSVFFSVRTAWP